MSRSSKSEFFSAPRIPTFKRLLAGWITVQRDYIQTMNQEDYPWNYHERACVGFLAAAAWSTGGVALEEWRTGKGPKADPRKGRCDLYVYRKNGYEFHIEAKHMWLPAGRRPSATTIEKRLNEAVLAANDLHCPRKEKLGVLFIAPYFNNKIKKDIPKRIADLLETVHSVPHSAIAWLIPDRVPIRPSDSGVFCPGIVLVAGQT